MTTEKNNDSLYDILNMRGNSIMKSVFISKRSDDSHANIRIQIEPYDGTYINAVDRHGEDYVIEQLEKVMRKESTRKHVTDHVGVSAFTGALVTLYGAMGQLEYYIR